MGIPCFEAVVIEHITPVVDAGRFASKCITGEAVRVEADVFAHGHDRVAGAVRYRHRNEAAWWEVELALLDNDRYVASFPTAGLGSYEFRVVAWRDDLGTWCDAILRKQAAGQDPGADLAVGAELVVSVSERATGTERARLRDFARGLAGRRVPTPDELRAVATLARRVPDPHTIVFSPVYAVLAERPLAGCSAWYELFPRSASPDPGRPGTLRDVVDRLPYVAALGFDVLYLPPIHPIGEVNRKGAENAATAGPEDPGSPWAIGSRAGGHDAIAPELGDLDDFAALLAAAAEHGLEVALDLALQCAPDHPWVREHPEWFFHRPDGSIAYAENPPKRYEDIVPLDFHADDWPALWDAVLGVVTTWVARGVRIFRVDNPHTKPFALWEWLLARVREDHPDVIFLAEAFTRPKVMHRLAKLGFSQSYTYFAWRETATELRDYFTELAHGPGADFFRPNAWPNTPDILPAHLQHGGRAGFAVRLVLAAMLSASYGVYGPAFELGVAEAREPGSEEYRNSEKYEVRRWDLDAAAPLAELIARVNRIRRTHPALRANASLHFHAIDNDRMLAWSKRAIDAGDVVLTVANLDPAREQSGWVWLDLGELGITDEGAFTVTDLLSGERFTWHGNANFVALDPARAPAHVFAVEPFAAAGPIKGAEPARVRAS